MVAQLAWVWQGFQKMRHNHFSLSILTFGGIILVLFAILVFMTVSSSIKYNTLVDRNVLAQGHWIVKSLEIGHSLTRESQNDYIEHLLKYMNNDSNIIFIIIFDKNKNKIFGSTKLIEEIDLSYDYKKYLRNGKIVKSDSDHNIYMLFPVFFTHSSEAISYHSGNKGIRENDAWIVIGLRASEAYAHYKGMIVQSIFVSIGMVILVLVAFVLFGIVQRYQLANASIEQLQRIKQQLGRFVPGTVQKLIEDNPERPLLDKVEHDATVLFLDIDHYTTIAAEMEPDTLNRLIENYFSAFLDIILAHRGEINETSGDGIMAVFTGKTPRTHALNAVRAAMAIRERVAVLNQEQTPHMPEILVNIGVNTGQVLLGATMIKGTAGERFTYTASGMVTNIASRLCDLSTQGDIHL
ncbi:MAG: adenylate/guanylate cyclase domain-containing protein, partial [Candidatus Tectomicrobia bacterium]|nr:adenylate/guanylate cyclase domain-containing protein [Candidatus Tectomicrobia bacterium]